METFVVRVWRAAVVPSRIPETWTAPLSGFVEHVGTGATARFGGGQELLRFLLDPSRPDTFEGVPASPDQGDR